MFPDAARYRDTMGPDWAQIEVLYGMLADVAPSPVVTLNRAVAVAETAGPEAALALVEPLLEEPALRLQHRVHAVHGHLLERLGRTEESRRHLAEFKRIEADLRRMEQLQAEIAKAPKNPAPRREMGLICLRNGQDQEALRWLYGVLDTHPNDHATHEALANHFQARGDTDRAFYHRSRAR